MESINDMLQRHQREREKRDSDARNDAYMAYHERRLAAAAEEHQRNVQIFKDRVAAMEPELELPKIAAAGISMKIDDDGNILVTPAGQLNEAQREMISQKRERVVAILKTRNTTEVI